MCGGVKRRKTHLLVSRKESDKTAFCDWLAVRWIISPSGDSTGLLGETSISEDGQRDMEVGQEAGEIPCDDRVRQDMMMDELSNKH